LLHFAYLFYRIRGCVIKCHFDCIANILIFLKILPSISNVDFGSMQNPVLFHRSHVSLHRASSPRTYYKSSQTHNTSYLCFDATVLSQPSCSRSIFRLIVLVRPPFPMSHPMTTLPKAAPQASLNLTNAYQADSLLRLEIRRTASTFSINK